MRKMIIKRHSRLSAIQPKPTITRGADLGGLLGNPARGQAVDYGKVDMDEVDRLAEQTEIARRAARPALVINRVIAKIQDLGTAISEVKSTASGLRSKMHQMVDPDTIPDPPDTFSQEHDIRDDLRKYGRVSGDSSLGELYDLELVDTDGDSYNWQTSEPSNYLVYSRGLRQLGADVGSRWWLLCNQTLRREAITRGDTARIAQYTKNLEPYSIGGFCG